MNEYHVLGVMSGSSLDGLDVCYSRFATDGDLWNYEILMAKTLELPAHLVKSLQNADKLAALDLYRLDVQYGEWIGHQLNTLLTDRRWKPELIGIHGHTVFHEPKDKLSVQIGSGEVISHITQLPVIDDFRTPDVVKGGQGAPLVPVGEHYLMPEYSGFVNLGGIANIAIHGEKINAWDVAPCNQILNHFARMLDQEYDHSGRLASSGKLNMAWLERISQLDYFHASPPKSLSNQWRKSILDLPAPEPKDALHTYSTFLANQLASELKVHLPANSKVLFTGGGTFNDFLIQRVQELLEGKLVAVIPAEDLISYKEALIFGFLGLLRKLDRPNVFSSVTGASADSVAGTIHHSDR